MRADYLFLKEVQLDNEPSSVLPGRTGIVSYVLKVLFSGAYLFFCILAA